MPNGKLREHTGILWAIFPVFDLLVLYVYSSSKVVPKFCVKRKKERERETKNAQQSNKVLYKHMLQASILIVRFSFDSVFRVMFSFLYLSSLARQRSLQSLVLWNWFFLLNTNFFLNHFVFHIFPRWRKIFNWIGISKDCSHQTLDEKRERERKRSMEQGITVICVET